MKGFERKEEKKKGKEEREREGESEERERGKRIVSVPQTVVFLFSFIEKDASLLILVFLGLHSSS